MLAMTSVIVDNTLKMCF